MVGGGALLGVIVPGDNVVLEPEFYKMAPDGVSVHSARLKPAENLRQEISLITPKEVSRAAYELRRMDVIGFGCTSASYSKGDSFDKEIMRIITEISRKPSVTVASAVIHALRKMGARNVSVATPYEKWVNRAVKQYLETAGIEVCHIESIERGNGRIDLSTLVLETAFRLAKNANRAEADSIFISCTSFRTVEVLDPLENELGKPVVSSNQALMWMLLKMCNFRGSIKGFGELLTKL